MNILFSLASLAGYIIVYLIGCVCYFHFSAKAIDGESQKKRRIRLIKTNINGFILISTLTVFYWSIADFLILDNNLAIIFIEYITGITLSLFELIVLTLLLSLSSIIYQAAHRVKRFLDNTKKNRENKGKKIGNFHSEKYNPEKKIVEIILKRNIFRKMVIESPFSFDYINKLFQFRFEHTLRKRYSLIFEDSEVKRIKEALSKHYDYYNSCISCGRLLGDENTLCLLCGFNNIKKQRENAEGK